MKVTNVLEKTRYEVEEILARSINNEEKDEFLSQELGE